MEHVTTPLYYLRTGTAIRLLLVNSIRENEIALGIVNVLCNFLAIMLEKKFYIKLFKDILVKMYNVMITSL